jgi:WD40 repeat protein
MVGAEYIFTGSRDCKLKILSKTYALLVAIDLKALNLNSISPEIRAIDMNAAKDKLVIGTFGHEVIEIAVDVPTKKVGEAQVLIHGHYAPMTKLTNEVWGLCPLQSRRQYVTVSDDATLRVWDTDSRKQLSLISLQVDKDGKEVKKNEKTGDINLLAQARAVDIDKSEEYLALGMRDGSLRVFKAAAEYPYWKEIASCKC